MKKFITLCAMLYCVATEAANPNAIEASISIKSPGNPAVNHPLTIDSKGDAKAQTQLPLRIQYTQSHQRERSKITVKLTAEQDLYFNLSNLIATNASAADCNYYLPGFWYRRNMRSPADAPSFHSSQSWIVREDRLSAPLTGIYDQKSGQYTTIIRLGELDKDALTTHNQGEVILSGETSLGFTGFSNHNTSPALHFGFPYAEGPRSYIRKLTLAPPVTAYQYLEKGETLTLSWELAEGKAADYSEFIAKVWQYSFDTSNPKPLANYPSTPQAKEVLSNYFRQAYVGDYPLKFTSGVHLKTEDCKSNGLAEVGFIGRVLLNAFNAYEYGEATDQKQLIEQGGAIFDSWERLGFTPQGFLREEIDQQYNKQTNIYSIRRQSEGAYAALLYLNHQKHKSNKPQIWEQRVLRLLNNFERLQNPDGSLPRKFHESGEVVDPSGGSTPSVILPLVLGYKYFGDKRYLEAAKRAAKYLEEHIISKDDYFSSTLDANCEDKEASLYTATAMYYLAMVCDGAEGQHYTQLCQKATYFAASWYYLWDVPFARGQMLGDIGLKSRGWGNVSVENNHIDVFVFEFADVLEWLAREGCDERFAKLGAVIRSSMLQLLPLEGSLCGVAKGGYYPEVVQHTAWDYGKNGKGFYNDIFAPGWVVASLWELLTPNRAEKFLLNK